MRICFAFAFVTFSLRALSQNISVQTDKFPNIKTVIVKSIGRGYRGEYFLDLTGRVQTEKRYRKNTHLATYNYTYTSTGYILLQVVSDNINRPNKIHKIYNMYEFSSDSTRVLTDLCYTDTDTLYFIKYLSFNNEGLPAKYTKESYARKKFISNTEMIYHNGNVASWKTTDRIDGKITFCEYTYNEKGDIISERRSLTPTSSGGNMWIDGQGDFMQWKYEYNKDGYWIHKYQLANGEYVLIETRKYIK